MIKIESLDHLVMTVKDINRTVEFYEMVLGMQLVEFGHGRKALTFGNQKINLHQSGHEFEPKAQSPTPGSADLCFITHCPIDEAMIHITENNVLIEAGPVTRTGAVGTIKSIYIRDPDQNLIEISNY
ncbi:MAG: VOC family protein [Neptuniibacter sp.]